MNQPPLIRLVLPTALLLCGIGLPASVKAAANYENYTFTSFVGPQESPGWYDGTNGAARFSNPLGLAVDGTGNVYVADTYNHTIRKITPAGAVTSLAGLAGSSGSTNGTGSAARFLNPFGVAVDDNGNVYVADTYNHLIRKITPAGEVTDFVGLASVSGTNNGTGTAARFNTPFALAVATNGFIYVADTYNHTIRMITPEGVVTTLAGSLTQSGTNNGVGSAAKFNYPGGVSVDTSNNVYVADTSNHTIRRITPAGVVSTLAGSPTVSGTNNGTGTAAKFYNPYGVSIDTNGIVYVADTYNQTIRKVTPAGVVTALAGAPGSSGMADGTNTTVRFNYPTGVATDRKGNVFVADYSNNLIRKATTNGVVTTLAGKAGGLGAVDAMGGAARFNFPSGIAVDGSTNTYIADLANHTIRKITPAGVVSTLAGLATVTGTNNGTGAAARFNTPTGVAVDTSGNVFVADTYDHTIRKITPAGVVTNFAGLAKVSGTNDGTGTAARFHTPFAVALGTNGTVFVADTGNHTIRKITPAGVVTTFAGSPTLSGTNDGVGSAARFYSPEGIAADGFGNAYVADTYNHTIRKVTAGGVVTTLAGIPATPGNTDGMNTTAQFYLPFGVAVDSAGNVYVAESENPSTYAGNHTVRKISPAGMVTTLAGLAGAMGSEDGSGPAARFHSPEGLAVTPGGVVYVADAGNHSIRKGYAAPTDFPVVDFPLEKPGVVRHLDVTNLSTTSWSWSIVRYPANSLSLLSSVTNRNPTFTPDLADLYAIRFQGSNGLGGLVIGMLEIAGIGMIEPKISSIQIVGSDVVLTGIGGAPGAIYSLLMSSNSALPISAWSALPGSKFDNNGGFILTNAFGASPRVYRIRVP